MVLQGDNSWFIKLTSEDYPTSVPNKAIVLNVDTGIWEVFYDGTWYPQNEATV